MRALSEEEANVIEDAIEFVQQTQHGRAFDALNARRALEKSVQELVNNFDGQWRRPTGV